MYFIFNDIDSRTLGITVNKMQVDVLAQQRLTKLDLPKWDGNHYEESEIYEAYSYTIECTVKYVFDLGKIAEVKNMFKSRRGMLISSKKPNNFMYARLTNQVDFSKLICNSGTFTLQFEVQPYSFLKTGVDFRVVTNTIANPTAFNSLPKYKVTHSSSNCQITINNKTMIFTNVTKQFIIDCEREDIYGVDGENLNYFMKIESDFQPLVPGNNSITTVGISKLEIQPNWREL